jgi:uroporphyrinogen decarboxylase
MELLTKKERMRSALLRQPVDRLPLQSNYTPVMGRRLADYFQIAPENLSERLDNHLLRLDVTYPARKSDDGKLTYDWWGAGWDTLTEGLWHSFAPLAHSRNLDDFPWPDPDAPHLMEAAAAQLAQDNGRHFVAPNLTMCLFERAWSLRGFESLLMDLVEQPEWVEELLDRITEIQLRVARRFLALGMDGGYFGDDYGAQRGMLFSPKIWRRLCKPRLALMFALFRDRGLPVILHSDGDIWAILPDLVEIGLTCLNPVQPEVMEHTRLYREFGTKISFYGGISTQTVMPVGTPAEIHDAVLACVQNLAPGGTGLVLGPSHRMQSDIPVENVDAMLKAFPAATAR